jgi:hypothetical protein
LKKPPWNQGFFHVIILSQDFRRTRRREFLRVDAVATRTASVQIGREIFFCTGAKFRPQPHRIERESSESLPTDSLSEGSASSSQEVAKPESAPTRARAARDK